jgi:hypothetical protein
MSRLATLEMRKANNRETGARAFVKGRMAKASSGNWL